MAFETDIGVGNPLPNSSCGMLNLLVVDDEPDICFLLATALEAIGDYAVTTATGARGARAVIENAEEPFQGIFLDIQMPETSGIELCRILRGTPGYAETPIIMLTAMTERHYLRDAFMEGASDYITKPFNLELIQTRFANERTKSRRRTLRRDAAETATATGQTALPALDANLSLHDSFTFLDVPRYVGVDAFHSYIKHSKARFADPLFIKTMKLNNAADLHARLTDHEFRALVRHVARCVSHATEGGKDIFTYCGHGVFFSACERENTLTQGTLDRALSVTGPGWDVAGAVERLDLVLGPEDAYGAAEPART